MTPRNIFIGVAWPYVNGNLHIGHLAGYLLPTDICARYHRLVGDNVLMVSGSDCHGTPITLEADKRGVTPKEIADEYHAKDVDLFENVLHLTYDLYTRTDTPHHAKVTQEFFLKLLQEGYILIQTTKQYYSDAEERFLPDRYIEGECPYCGFKEARSDQCDNCTKLIEQGELINPISRISQSEVRLKETQHYFIDWSKLQPQIEEYVNHTSHQWKEWVAQETKGWLAEKLQPRPITRDIDWGVKIPVDRIPPEQIIDNAENKRFYVWFDAVIGYFSASLLWSQQTGGDWKKFWYGNQVKHYYFMGKDNLVFHTIFWPGKLIVYDSKLHLPDIPSINQFLNFDGQQFSKSRGVVVDSREIVEKFGNDFVRFYLTYIMPEKRDTSFSWLDFQQRVNNILIGNFGNYIHRVLSIGHKTKISELGQAELAAETTQVIKQAFQTSRDSLERSEYKPYLNAILELSAYGNKQFDYEKVWELRKNDRTRFSTVLTQLYAIVIALGYLVQPLLFESADKIFSNLGITEPSTWPPTGNEAQHIHQLLQQIDTSISPQRLYLKITDEQIAELIES